MSIKEYIYTTGDKIQLWSANLSAKMEAVRQNQDEILKFKKSIEDLVKESGDVTESIQKTADNIGEYDIGQIRDISDIGGIKKLVADLKETRSVANKSIADLKKHIESVKKAGKSAEDTVKDIDESEKAIGELMQAEADAAKVQAKAEDHLNEDLLEEKDQAANRATKADPEETTEDCPLKDCTIDYFTVEDSSGRMIAFDNNVEPEEAPAKNKASSDDDKESSEEEKKDPPPPTTLYVICGEKEGYTEEITIKSNGDCKNGAACPAVTLKGGSVDENAAVNLTKIKLKSEKIIPEKSWGDFLRKVIVPDMKVLAKPVTYEVNVHDCDSKDDISELKIISFPPAGWSGKASIEYKEKSDSEKKKIKEENKDQGFPTAKPMGDWKIGGEMKCYLDDVDWKFEPPKEFLNSVQECLSKIAPLFNEIDNDYAKITIGWPNLELDGKIDLAEVPDYHQLSYDGYITLKADPFLDLKIDVDVKAIILRIIGKHKVFSDFMMDILNRLEEGVGTDEASLSAKIEIKLKTHANISGDLHWKRTAKDGKWSVDTEKCKLGGSMGIELYGAVHVEGNMFCVKASAGASLSIRSKDGKDLSRFSIFWAALEGMENPSLERQMEFNGLAIYYSKYAQLGVDDTKAGKAIQKVLKRSRVMGGKKATTKSTAENNKLIDLGNKDDMNELCILMDTWKSTNEKTNIGKDPI